MATQQAQARLFTSFKIDKKLTLIDQEDLYFGNAALTASSAIVTADLSRLRDFESQSGATVSTANTKAIYAPTDPDLDPIKLTSSLTVRLPTYISFDLEDLNLPLAEGVAYTFALENDFIRDATVGFEPFGLPAKELFTFKTATNFQSRLKPQFNIDLEVTERRRQASSTLSSFVSLTNAAERFKTRGFVSNLEAVALIDTQANYTTELTPSLLEATASFSGVTGFLRTFESEQTAAFDLLALNERARVAKVNMNSLFIIDVNEIYLTEFNANISSLTNLQAEPFNFPTLEASLFTASSAVIQPGFLVQFSSEVNCNTALTANVVTIRDSVAVMNTDSSLQTVDYTRIILDSNQSNNRFAAITLLALEDTATIDWGDGNTSTVTTNLDQSPRETHEYVNLGIYEITVDGNFDRIQYGSTMLEGITEIKAWGTHNSTSLSLSGCSNLTKVDNHVEKSVTGMNFMFNDATIFNGDISNWNTSSVTNMSYMFRRALNFNGDIYNWNTSNVTDMSSMFSAAQSFNGDMPYWNTFNVTDMEQMFISAESFNGDISWWDTGNVTNMSNMFRRALNFNGDISFWNTANVTDMSLMFQFAAAFNGDMPYWNTFNVTDMHRMFFSAQSFNGNISNWDTSIVTDMSNMFGFALVFNGDISNWNLRSVTDMSNMFSNASAFNRNISNWNTANVNFMGNMFRDAETFNQNLSGWCVPTIASKPNSFDTGASSWTLPNSRPVWGTCP